MICTFVSEWEPLTRQRFWKSGSTHFHFPIESLARRQTEHAYMNRMSRALPIFMFWRVPNIINRRKWEPPQPRCSHFNVRALQRTQIHENKNRMSQAVPMFMFWLALSSINSRKLEPPEPGGSHFCVAPLPRNTNSWKWKPPESGGSHFHVLAYLK